jgi:RimJ/RimL family protein N-acetyltransferase
MDPPAGSIEVGWIAWAPAMQRTRAATEAIWLMMDQAFRLGFRRFEWKCNALNAASRRAAQRFGLSYEGVFRQASVVKGRNRDTAWYAAIDREYPALRAAFAAWLDPANFDSGGVQRRSLADLTAPVLAARG